MNNAFEQFERLSKHFLKSYSSMESKVTQLSKKLACETSLREKTAEEKERLGHRLEHLLNIMPVGVIILDCKGFIQECNQAADLFFTQEIVGVKWSVLVDKYFVIKDDDCLEASMIDGKRVKIETRSLEPESGQMVILHDMTETRKLQEHQNRNQRLSTIGRMIASLSHQIRTPLSAAILYASHLIDYPNEQQQKKCQDKLLERLSNIDKQIKDMLLFARGESPKREWCSIKNFTSFWINMVDEMVSHHAVNYVKKIDLPDDFSVLIHKEDFSGALMNVIENSIQAMSTTEKYQSMLTIDISVNEEVVNFMINDNGSGIEPEKLDEVFEPFYTTKQNGTGLGLSVVNSVVRQHSGELVVRSKPGLGTQFVISLPLRKITH
ncbi:MAG: ATP-binding protein [Pseudomonadota bacterium]